MSYTFKPGDPIWVDLFTADPDRAIAFYGELLGWTAERSGPEMGGYIIFSKDGKPVAGGMRNEGGADGPDRWTVYLNSPDAQATADAVTANGGQVTMPPMDVADQGRMAVVTDPGGAEVGVWQPGAHPGFGALGTVSGGEWSEHVGVPSWFELHTSAYPAALDFYRTAFGWQDPFTISDAAEFRYTTIHSTTPMLGGIMDTSVFAPVEVPGGWQVYFGVADVDAAVKAVRELGGSVRQEPEDTPYGRMAAVADPTGVGFRLGGNKS
ncbi:VOC family protein [Nocardia blacklockiae]|uniref:VOC family protein n=1 Tax=Nocardia blacklockiae TaxID=480036 RepID=UPI0018941B99|nr:VOC family protein [Nocardia blacklockiae]MBF6172146.1 VOC family protein [Nocardia blacklockiae]